MNTNQSKPAARPSKRVLMILLLWFVVLAVLSVCSLAVFVLIVRGQANQPIPNTGGTDVHRPDLSTPTAQEKRGLEMLENYFTTITDFSSNCSPSQDSLSETVATFACEFPQKNLTVQYDYWESLPALEDFTEELTTSYPGVTAEQRETGVKYEFIDEQGRAVLFWTTPAKQMSGLIIANHANQQAVNEWWFEVGGVYFFNEAEADPTE